MSGRSCVHGRASGQSCVRAAGSSRRWPAYFQGRTGRSQIDEEEYWRRLSALEEHFAAGPKGGAA
ncbi:MULTISPECIES: hypothetical protein [unclassified Streptomyces]|uniref:hypothetical protein n=1 Tax=unclassified Streptomyces TaxID=2593676 RepID=UPI000D1BAF55|nr:MULTISPECIES: hypothetical protein [unclassified Streptomyces]